MNIRNLIKYSYTGILPQPGNAEREHDKKVWNLKIDIMNLLGKADKQIEKEAKKEYESDQVAQIGCGSSGTKKWERGCENWRKYSYVSNLLPDIEIFDNEFESKKLIQFTFEIKD